MARTNKQGSTWPPLRLLLQDEDGPVDLTTADSVELRAKGPTTTLTGAMIADAGQGNPPGPIDEHETGRGWVQYDLDAGETEELGVHRILVKVTWNVGDIEWFPNSGAETWTIEAL